MEKILVLENEHSLDDSIQVMLDKLLKSHPDYQVQYLYGTKHRMRSEIAELISWCTMIFSDTTLTDYNQNSQMIDLLASIKSSKKVCLVHYQLKKALDQFMQPKDYWSIRQHKIYEVERGPWNDFKMYDINIDTETSEYQQFIDNEKTIRDNIKNKTTGRKIEILDIVAFNSEFNNLKKGMIVDELDASEIDPNPKRGIWVWGVTEPVKLLNEPHAVEYKIATLVDLV